MRILVVEDDKDVAGFVVRGLKEAGHVVEHADNGRDGLFLAASESFDAIVLAGSGIGRGVEAGAVVLGYPAVPKDEFMANFLFVRRLKRMTQRLDEIEKRVETFQLRSRRSE